MNTEEFATHRPRLFGIAYRMLGSRADAEDVVQDAYIRWHQAAPPDLRSTEAWLVTLVTRLSIDRLRAAKAERTSYVGPWLPEPLSVETSPGPEERLTLAEDLSLAFLTVLERLAPDERAAFLLHDVFDFDYPDIAAALSKSEPAVRQTVHRARQRVHRDRPRFSVSPQAHLKLLERFLAATREGDAQALMALVAEDVTVTSDGGGKVRAIHRVLHGAERAVRFWTALARWNATHPLRVERQIGQVNGEPAILNYVEGRLYSVTTIVTDGRRILGVYSVLNPDKLPR
jgi:RNA polymerase sigma-70 factor (ECF subfamily)